MKNKPTSMRILGLFAVLCAALVLTACPRHIRPHPHRLPRPVLPMDSMLQLERQGNAALLSVLVTEPVAASKDQGKQGPGVET